MHKRQRLKKKPADVMSRWSCSDAAELYGIDRWGGGVFAIGADGCLHLAGEDGAPAVNLRRLVEEIRERGIDLPVLIRFTDVLRRRLRLLNDAFAKAIKKYRYKGKYRGVYPIKVNQHRHVLEDIVEYGKPCHIGLEAGSKPELLLAVAHHTDAKALVICNGFKDRDYIETALMARRLGQNVFIVLEKLAELDLVLAAAKRLNVAPQLGIRMKLASRGKGLWESSGGDRSKFGLFAQEIVEAIHKLKRAKRLESLKLLHFHIGSQIADIQRFKSALREATAIFAEVRRLGAPITHIDVGGGLAVDYDGSRTNFASSANYGLSEYAEDIVDAVHTVCQECDLPHPTLVSESGRALTAHHSVLVVEALGVNRIGGDELPRVSAKTPDVVRWIRESYESLSPKNFQTVFHDAVETRREALARFNFRQLSLKDRGKVEAYFWAICRKIRKYAAQLDYVPDEFEGLQAHMATLYTCNFSVFQSLPDHWALKQLFPVVPLQRLDEEPTAEAILGDLTCDSDGVVDRFVDLRDVKYALPLHPLKRGDPYYLGIFLVGAYQEILGDLHNLFGDTNAVHVSSDGSGHVIDKVLTGDTTGDVLGYLGFAHEEIVSRLRARADAAVKKKRISLPQFADFLRHVEVQLDKSTYPNSGEK